LAAHAGLSTHVLQAARVVVEAHAGEIKDAGIRHFGG
jgi:hypothetical protein